MHAVRLSICKKKARDRGVTSASENAVPHSARFYLLRRKERLQGAQHGSADMCNADGSLSDTFRLARHTSACRKLAVRSDKALRQATQRHWMDQEL